MLYHVEANANLATDPTWQDVIGRSVVAGDLILDTNRGMLDMMVDSTYPGQPGPRPVIGEDIKAVARKLSRSGT